MKRLFVLAALFLFLFFPSVSFAWGTLGHRIVASIADSYLSAKAKAEIKKILGNESLAMASNWADFVKSDSSYNYMETWHYIDFKKGLSYGEMKSLLKSDTAADIWTKLNFVVSELKKKNLPGDKKRLYLRVLVHLVGDCHQPLHVGVEGTAGGNDIKLNWFSTPSNLHRVWDSDMIESQKLSYSEYVADINHTTANQRKLWQSQPITLWFYESYTKAQALENEITGPNPRLSYRYNYDHLQTLNDQLLKGGVRLAGLLNSIFGS